MPHMNGTGPEGKGSKTGRKLGKCITKENEEDNSGSLGRGLGLKRHSGGGDGKGKRKKNSINTKYWINEDENSCAGK